MTDKEKIIHFYALQKSKDLMSLSDIRKELAEKSYTETEITAIIKEIDNQTITLLKEGNKLQKNKLKLLTGYILMTIAAILSVLVFSKILIAANDYSLFLLFLPLLIGYGLIFSARKKIKQKQ